MFNIKISPKQNDEDFTTLYSELIKKLFKKNIAINTRSEKWMQLRTQFSHENDKVLYGKIIYYTKLDNNDWFNSNKKEIEKIELDKNLHPNAKEIEYFFIPEAHRFCFINKSNGIAISQVEIFLKDALPKLIGDDKQVIVTQELTYDVIEKIINSPSLTRLEVGVSYSNNDLTDDFEALFDDDMRDSEIQHFNMTAKSFSTNTIKIGISKILKAALKLSQSNGYAKATIKNDEGKNENIATTEYPRKESVSSTEGNEHKDVFLKIIRLFRNG